MILGIDPGVSACGWALMGPEGLIAAGVAYDKSETLLYRGWAMSQHIWGKLDSLPFTLDDLHVIVESMDARGSRVPAQDLIDVQTVAVSLCVDLSSPGAHSTREMITASVWKGTIPKEVHHARIERDLSPQSRAVLKHCLLSVPKKNHKEVLDAVGLAMYARKRRGVGQ